MERRFSRNLSNESRESVNLQKKIAETRRPNRPESAPDLTDFMNDMFFGTVNSDKKAYNLTGGLIDDDDYDEREDFESSRRSVSSRLTDEWLEEAKRMVALSPSRCVSPSRLTGSPRFAASPARLSVSSYDSVSRSARRHRAVESFSGEILSKTAKHTRNNSGPLDPPPPAEISPASAVHQWFSDILKPLNPTPPPHSSAPTNPHANDHPTTTSNHTAPTPPHPPLTHRKSRFQKNTNATQPQTIPPHPPSKRTFKTTRTDTQVLSPPKHLISTAHKRSVSSSTSFVPDSQILSPPRNLVESAHRRSVSSSTCYTDRILQKPALNEQLREEDDIGRDLNGFLTEQRAKIGKIVSGEINGKANIVFAAKSNSTSSMVAAICYAWLLENMMNNNEGGEEDGNVVVVVPVMNMRREKMWKQRQAARLFHHIGVDATALLFSEEVDMETLMMSKKLSILVVGQDILKTNGEVASACTILTDNYCEHAYDLLQTPVLRKLLLAGILLDTQNLDISAKLSKTKDTEAVQLLSVGSVPGYRNALYDQLMQDQRDCNFFEALRHNYGKPPNEGTRDGGAPVAHRVSERNHEPVIRSSDKGSNDVKNVRASTPSPNSATKPKSLPTQSPAAAPAQAADASRGKNKFSLAKWFGFGK
ncbi:unnamed protein product [Ilex paraguariensis]|uniref:Exopolyphosphatase n=1 Tax=Ilex paraguariensis TaxID=185542 RepID=A0ABC8R6Z0_9AQUA